MSVNETLSDGPPEDIEDVMEMLLENEFSTTEAEKFLAEIDDLFDNIFDALRRKRTTLEREARRKEVERTTLQAQAESLRRVEGDLVASTNEADRQLKEEQTRGAKREADIQELQNEVDLEEGRCIQHLRKIAEEAANKADQMVARLTKKIEFRRQFELFLESKITTSLIEDEDANEGIRRLRTLKHIQLD